MDPNDAKDLERYIRDKNKTLAKGKLVEVAQLCNTIGELYSKYGRYEEAIEEHEEERRVSEALADRIGEAVACRLIGECRCALGQYKEALEQQKKHLSLARECKNDLEEQRAWATIGRTYLCQVEETRNVMESSLANQQAERSFFRALAACEKVKTARLVTPAEYMAMKARLYLNIGLVYDNRHDTEKSTDAVKKAIAVAEKHKLDTELRMCYESLAEMCHNHGRHAEAVKNFEIALKYVRKLRDKVSERDLLIREAMTHVSIGDFLEAKHCLKKAHKLKIEGNISTEKLRKTFKIVTKIQEAKADLDKVEEEEKVCRLHEVKADGLAELGICKEAIKSYITVLSYGHLLSTEQRAAIYTSLAQTYSDDKDYNSAIFYYKKELELQKNNPEQSCLTYLNIAELEELNGGKYAAVCKVYMEAFEYAKKAKRGKLMIQTLRSLIELQKLCEQQKHLEQSEKTLAAVRRKYGEEEMDVSQVDEDADDKVGKDNEKSGDTSLSEMTVSDESDNDSDGISMIVPKRRKRTFNRTNEKGETPLHRACINGNLKKVKALVMEGHPLNPRDYCGWLPLHEACNHGFPDIVEFLLESGAWINDRGGERCGGVTPLIDAANCGNMAVVQALLSYGANVMAKDDDGNTAYDCLQTWYSRAEKLDVSEKMEYKKTEQLLLDCLGKKNGPKVKRFASKDSQGPSKTKLPHSQVTNQKATSGPANLKTSAATTNLKANSTARNRKRNSEHDPVSLRLPDLSDSDEGPQETLSSTVKARLSELRRKRISNKSQRQNRNRRTEETVTSASDSSDLENIYIPTLDTVRVESDNATQVYQNAMTSLRTSAKTSNRKDDKDRKGEESLDEEFDPTPGPYYAGNKPEGGDDLLVDDLAYPTSKKRSADISKILTTTSTRKNVTGLKKRKMNATTVTATTKFVESHDLDSDDDVISEEPVGKACLNRRRKELTDSCDRIVSNNRGDTVKLSSSSVLSGLDKTSRQLDENSAQFQNSHRFQIENSGHQRDANSIEIEKSNRQTASDEELWGPDVDDDDFLYESNFLDAFDDPTVRVSSSSNAHSESMPNTVADRNRQNGVSAFDRVGSSSWNNPISSSSSAQVSSTSDANRGTNRRNGGRLISDNPYSSWSDSNSSSADTASTSYVSIIGINKQNERPTCDKTRPSGSYPNSSTTSLIGSTSKANTLSYKKPNGRTTSSVSSSDNAASRHELSSLQQPPTRIANAPRRVEFSFKVKIDGKTILVPVMEGEKEKPMAWLAQEAADRYFNSFLVRPMLTFKSLDGCVVCHSDPVSLYGAEAVSELHTEVHAWSRPTAVERYDKACKNFYVEPKVVVKSALENIGKSGRVDLTDLSLDFGQLLPVFQALNGEKTLSELNLNGNRLNDLSMDNLASQMDALPSLRVLRLESNELTAKGLETLASYIQGASHLQYLTSLSLSYNHLSDKAEPWLKLLLKSLPDLTTLRVMGCYFTPKLFTPALLEAFKGCSLECLAISENLLTKKCLLSLFESMKTDRLSHLDLSQCLAGESNDVGIESLLQPITSHEKCHLQSLSLANCHLSREDVLEVIRLPIKVPSLVELVISLNQNVTATSLQKLLFLSSGKESRLKSLVARGCSVRSPLSEEFVEAVRGKLGSDFPLSKLVFSCRAMTAAESALLESAWRQHWGDQAVIKVSGMILNFSTSDSSMSAAAMLMAD